MNLLKESQRRQIILDFYQNNVDKGKSYTVKHFELMKINRRSTYQIINSNQVNRKSGSGGGNRKMQKLDILKLKRQANNKCGIYFWRLNLMFLNLQYIETLKKLVLYIEKKTKVPKVTEKQLLKQKMFLPSPTWNFET